MGFPRCVPEPVRTRDLDWLPFALGLAYTGFALGSDGRFPMISAMCRRRKVLIVGVALAFLLHVGHAEQP